MLTSNTIQQTLQAQQLDKAIVENAESLDGHLIDLLGSVNAGDNPDVNFNEISQEGLNTKLEEFGRDREEFLETGDKSIFNKYLQRRASLGGDTEEYDTLVNKIIENTEMKVGPGRFNATTQWDEITDKTEMDDFLKYLTAASIVEVINSTELIDAIVSGPNKFKIGMFEREQDSNVVGKYTIDGDIMLDGPQHIIGLLFQDSNNTMQHEVLHRLDHSLGNKEGDRFTDGIIEAMTKEDLELFERGRELLAEKHRTEGTSLPEYAFSDIDDGAHEFLAVAIELLEEPQKLIDEGEGGEAIYTALTNTFNIDPLSYTNYDSDVQVA